VTIEAPFKRTTLKRELQLAKPWHAKWKVHVRTAIPSF